MTKETKPKNKIEIPIPEVSQNSLVIFITIVIILAFSVFAIQNDSLRRAMNAPITQKTNVKNTYKPTPTAVAKEVDPCACSITSIIYITPKKFTRNSDNLESFQRTRELINYKND